jgi:hypothetical protein
LQQKIISLLETASQACDQLTALDEANSENIKKLIADYVGGVRVSNTIELKNMLLTT